MKHEIKKVKHVNEGKKGGKPLRKCDVICVCKWVEFFIVYNFLKKYFKTYGVPARISTLDSVVTLC